MSAGVAAAGATASESPRFTLAPGVHVGRYQLVRGLARGGMGEVYLARMPVAGGHKLVALKRMLPDRLDDADGRAMFVREASVALRLDHTGVVQVLDILEDHGEHAIVMEYIHGRSARDLLRRWSERTRDAGSLGAALSIVIGVAVALHYVHELRDDDGHRIGLVHRDVSPENIMVRFDGGTKLIDFGIARISAATAATNVGVLKGKVGYMSPEQIRQDPLDRRSDVFQLGIVLYELITGRRAFVGENFAAVMNAVLSGDLPSVRDTDANVPHGLAEIVDRAMAYEPEDRYSSAEAFAAAVVAFAASAEIACSPDVAAGELERLFGSPPPPRTDTTLATPDGVGRKQPGAPRTAWILAGGVLALLLGGVLGARAALDRGAAVVAGTEGAAVASYEAAQQMGIAAGVVAVLGLLLVAVGWRRSWVARASLAVATLGGTGCAPPEFRCTSGRACDAAPDGWCDPMTAHCAYEDGACAGGGRYGPLAGLDANACVDQQPTESPTVYAWRIERAVDLDGDPSELQLGPPLRLFSDFGVSGEFWLRWNDDGLYLGAAIVDPQVEGSRRAHEPLWDEDGIEVLFDTAWDRAAGGMPGADDFKFVVTAINVSSTSWGGIEPRTAWALPIASAVVIDGTANQGADTDGGYSLELFVPWSERFAKPAVGTAWGANFRINDHRPGESRGLTWRTEGRFNYPASAGVLAFADRSRPLSLRAAGIEVPPGRPFEKLDLAGFRVGDSENFAAKQPVEQLFDGCLGTRPNCAAGTAQEQSFTVRFDFGQPRQLASARLFGDTKHEWVSRSWTLSYRLDAEAPWVDAFSERPAFVDEWVFAALDGVSARYVRVRVLGDTGKGAEAAELELYARPLPNSAP